MWSWRVGLVCVCVCFDVVCGLVVNMDGRCETLRLVVHPSGVYPLNSVDAGVVRHVFVPALSGKGDGVRSLPAGCDLDELTVASSEKISDSFVVLRTGSECSLDKRQTNAKALGAVGMLLVFGAENANEGVQIDGIEPDSIPFSFLSSSDWTKIAQCKDANISLLVLSDDLLYMSFGGMLQWTLVRGIAFWFSLQAIICIAAVQRIDTFSNRSTFLAMKRREIIQRLATIKFRQEVDGDDGEDPTLCAVCLDDIRDGDSCRKLTCDHLYHVDCIDKWLHKSNSCPLCKRNLPLLSGLSLPSASTYGAVQEIV